MSLFTSGILADTIKGVFGVVDDLHTSEEEKIDMKIKLEQVLQAGSLAQLEVNKAEAQSGILFVSGWRPFVGWTCGSALAWTYVLSPVIQSGAFYVGQFTGRAVDLSQMPVFDLSTLMPVLLGMLGLGGLRTYEKVKGVERTDMNDTEKAPKGRFKRGKSRGT